MSYKSWIPVALAAWLLATPVFAADTEDRSLEFRVTGMSCALCVPAIEKGLRDVEGVRSVSVDREAERIQVVAQESVTAASLESAIERAGHFEAEFLTER